MKTVLICSLLIGGHIDHSVVKSPAECRARGAAMGASMIEYARFDVRTIDPALCNRNLPAGVSSETCPNIGRSK